MNCDETCEKDNVPCNRFGCDNFIDYEDDLNCVLVCARKNGPLTLEQAAKRLGVSYVRIKIINNIFIEYLGFLKFKSQFIFYRRTIRMRREFFVA